MKDLQIVFLDNDVVKFGLSKPLNSITGINNLIQRILKLFLTEKYTNIFEPDFGSQIYSLLHNSNINDVEEVRNILDILIRDVVTTIKNYQITDISNGVVLEDSEILEDINLLDIKYDELFSGWVIKLLIITKSNLELELTLY